jgi:hypothetical protein
MRPHKAELLQLSGHTSSAPQCRDLVTRDTCKVIPIITRSVKEQTLGSNGYDFHANHGLGHTVY